MNDTTAELMATAAAKAEAHNGLSSALEYGTVSILRLNGTWRITAVEDGRRFIVTVSPATGRTECNGYLVSSTCRDLAHAAVKAHRNR